MTRIEPGMLCLVVGDPDCQQNIGITVTALRPINRGGKIDSIGELGHVRLWSGDDFSSDWLCAGDLWVEDIYDGPELANHSAFSERNLMPLSGGDKLEDLETVEDLERVT